MHIRKYKPFDREAIEFINYETGFLGRSMSKFLSNNKLWKKSIGYYLNKEPDNVFVLEDQNKIVGYIVGCLNYNNYNQSMHFVLSVFRNFIGSIFLSKKDRIFWISKFMNLFDIIFGKSGELKFKTPENAAHIHINLLPGARGKKYGSMLFKKFEEHSIKNGVKIIYANSYQTKLNPNTNFWLKNGFKVYSKVKTTIWKKQLPNEIIFLVCYYKILN